MTANTDQESWLLPKARKDEQLVTGDWHALDRPMIDGVVIKEVRHVSKRGGYLTEIVRSEWLGNTARVDQVFQSVLDPRTVSAWHAHERSTDRLFVSYGRMKIVLFDARPGSPTRGLVTEHVCGTEYPALITVPPKVWHGVQSIGTSPSILLNAVDEAYDYADPDHWRVAEDSSAIPYRFRN